MAVLDTLQHSKALSDAHFNTRQRPSKSSLQQHAPLSPHAGPRRRAEFSAYAAERPKRDFRAFSQGIREKEEEAKRFASEGATRLGGCREESFRQRVRRLGLQDCSRHLGMRFT